MLGNQIAMTQGVNELIRRGKVKHDDVLDILGRFSVAEYGEIDKDSVRLNKLNIRDDISTVMGVYTVNDVKLWIITTLPARHSNTVIMLPEEY